MNIRIKFQKSDRMAFLGHLDLMRYFQKALRRAGFPLEFSKGFHPHPIISFAQPLSVGTTSDGEYFDVKLTEEIDTFDYLNRLKSQMIPGMDVSSIIPLEEKAKTAMSIVSAADYEIEIIPKEECGPSPTSILSKVELEKSIEEFLSQDEILYVKQTKKNEITKNIRPGIYNLTCIGENPCRLYAFLQQGSQDNLPPKPVAELLLRFIGIDKDSVQIKLHRIDIYFSEKDGFISLDMQRKYCEN